LTEGELVGGGLLGKKKGQNARQKENRVSIKTEIKSTQASKAKSGGGF